MKTKMEATFLTKCNHLGVKSMGLDQARDTKLALLCGIFNALDGSEDDVAYDDVPSVESFPSDSSDAEDDVDGLVILSVTILALTVKIVNLYVWDYKDLHIVHSCVL